MMDAKINNWNTTFLRGTVANQQLTKPSLGFTLINTTDLSAKDHFMLMTRGHHSIPNSNKT